MKAAGSSLSKIGVMMMSSSYLRFFGLFMSKVDEEEEDHVGVADDGAIDGGGVDPCHDKRVFALGLDVVYQGARIIMKTSSST